MITHLNVDTLMAVGYLQRMQSSLYFEIHFLLLHPLVIFFLSRVFKFPESLILFRTGFSMNIYLLSVKSVKELEIEKKLLHHNSL